MLRYLPILESLERRDTPAGTVTGSFANGTWTLVGDADANDISIDSASPGEYSVSGLNGTTVAGVTDATGASNIVIKLGQGNDSVAFNDAGDPTLIGSLSIFGGQGNNYASINHWLVFHNLSIRHGQGFDILNLADSLVLGNVVVENGRGGSNTNIYRSNAEDSNFIGGNLIVRNESGADYTEVADTHIGGNVLVVNGLPDADGLAGDVYIYNDEVTTGRSIIKGNVSISYQGGNLEDWDGIWDTEVLGNVTFDYGGGHGELHFDGYSVNQPVHVHGNLTVRGLNATVMDVGRQFLKTGLVVDGNLTLRTSGQADLIQAFQLHVGGTTHISTGGGADQIFIDDSSFAGRVMIDTGAGADDLQIESMTGTAFGTQFQSALNVALGAGNDTLRFGIIDDSTAMVELIARSFLDGGAGTDSLAWLNLEPAFFHPDIKFFETLPD